jgi:hypothetical protein
MDSRYLRSAFTYEYGRCLDTLRQDSNVSCLFYCATVAHSARFEHAMQELWSFSCPSNSLARGGCRDASCHLRPCVMVNGPAKDAQLLSPRGLSLWPGEQISEMKRLPCISLPDSIGNAATALVIPAVIIERAQIDAANYPAP